MCVYVYLTDDDIYKNGKLQEYGITDRLFNVPAIKMHVSDLIYNPATNIHQTINMTWKMDNISHCKSAI